ncbi:dihydrolipoamide acetyltransferase family protein [Mesorhizobium sp.]|uniref:dihydrolipoamide acetyltransferase family protein n=1 Tax=Mesorhizobium sp. TaxID=1871066 RepID=UPI0012028576|nr:dihydrolipoamide acetyltransferase family protein [Mesorhizobium sp.]TIO05597.1 MAG: 2-oxo acid dehydrogenase subunit E2 [Mesorhizobium sp.]TIO29915.1 MAG: 2-oxo acid dehydrogenase subunit E2 [Mesorhizobium sp.]TIP08806.1 MAG: 2-oxo acid dehydrogenase subunit E2 [Mesorhizobium sp.]
MSDFLMPSLGADMERGKLVEWLVKPGSEVKKGDVIAIVETHKGAFEVDIFEEGVISELCAGEGQEVPVGGVLARLMPSNSVPAIVPPPGPMAPTAVVKAPEVALAAPPSPGAPSASAKSPTVAQKVSSISPASRARAKVTPAAGRRAAELEIDPYTLKGTGIYGSVTIADVERASASQVSREASARPTRPGRGFDPLQMRQAIAAAMSRSKREIPHYYLTTTIDMGPSLSWLETFNTERPPDQRLLPATLFLKATALALREVPQFNGFWENGRFRPGSGIHIGWAVSLRGGGLIAPAVHDVDTMTLSELMSALRDLVARARGGGLRSSEMTNPSFTVTSLGERGADSVIGVIYPPQVATLGFGRIAVRPWVIDDKVTARPIVVSSLAADHRASDGHAGGLFLAAVDRLLQEPVKL